MPVFIPPAIVVLVVAFARIIVIRWVAFWASRVTQFIALLLAGNSDAIINFFTEFTSLQAIKDEFTQRAMAMIADAAFARCGLVLDPADPLSNESLSNAIGNRIGITLHDIMDREVTLHDVGVAMAQRVNVSTGAHFDSFYPVDTVPDQMGREVTLAIEAAIQGGAVGVTSWVPQIYVNQLITVVRAFDGVIAGYTPKKERLNMMARLRQRKYALTHKRVGMWVPR